MEIHASLSEHIRDKIKENGKIAKIESEVHAMVLDEIRGGDKSAINSTTKNENSPTQFANHLILEYLEWMNFQYTKDLFKKESGVGVGPSRSILESQVDKKKNEFDGELPILMTLALKLVKQ